MALHNLRFPDRIAYNAEHCLTGKTDVVTLRSGEEDRNARWAARRRVYDVALAAKFQADVDELRAHFEAVDAMADSFPFKDWSDFKITQAESRVAGVTSTTFQLQKAYVSGARTTLRDIRLPRPTAVYASGSPVTWSFDIATGLVTIASAPSPAAVTWRGEFDTLVRYGTDELRGHIVNRNPAEGFIYSFASIPLLEVIGE